MSLPQTAVQALIIVIGLLKLLRWVVRRNWKTLKVRDELDIQGKIVVITGANSGIGKITAYQLADRGAHVVLACRDVGKGDDAVEWIRGNTRRGELTCMKLDLSSLKSIRQFCNDFENRFDKVDILINNAGVYLPPSKNATKTRDGFEVHMGVNHLGHFLLTNLLVDLLKHGAPSRIITISSFAHNYYTIDLNDLMSEAKPPNEGYFFLPPLYARSKLANVLFTKELAKRLEGTRVTCYAVCPGMVDTELGRNIGGVVGVIVKLIKPVVRFVGVKSPEEGAETTVYCALSRQLENSSGEMYQHCGVWDPKDRVYLKDEDGVRLWVESERLVGLDTSLM